MLCPFCKETIADGSIKCKHCKSMLVPISQESQNNQDNPIWTSIVSLSSGLLAFIADFSVEVLTRDEKGGIFTFSVAAIIVGAVSLNKKHSGRGMAIAGIILGIIGIFS